MSDLSTSASFPSELVIIAFQIPRSVRRIKHIDCTLLKIRFQPKHQVRLFCLLARPTHAAIPPTKQTCSSGLNELVTFFAEWKREYLLICSDARGPHKCT